MNDLDPAARDLEGYLFPETYTLPRGTPVAKLIAMMVDQISRHVLGSSRRNAAASPELSLRRARDAGVARREGNGQGGGAADRRRGLPQPPEAAIWRCRPTRQWFTRWSRPERYDGNIRRQDLAIDSPYNTYKYPGLPPGPIASPGRAALEAALAPADVNYLYFVSRNDGSHVFAETLAQHNANVYQYQVLYFRNQRLERQRQRNSTQ